MDDTKLQKFKSCFCDAFIEVLCDMTGMQAVNVEQADEFGSDTISVILGTVGKNKGRILFKSNVLVATAIAEKMNGEPFEDIEERDAFLGEFTNIFCGNAITRVNNHYAECELRLTPPAVFAGEGIQIITPNIDSEQLIFRIKEGQILLDIGFEGE